MDSLVSLFHFFFDNENYRNSSVFQLLCFDFKNHASVFFCNMCLLRYFEYVSQTHNNKFNNIKSN